jgi:GAF domain-containing protein
MPQESAFERSLAALSLFFVGDRTEFETLNRITAMTQAALPDAEFVGITMMANGRVETAVFTDPESPEIDQAQYATGEGPCLESFRTGEVRRIESTLRDGPWPVFRASCRDHDILSTLSVPLTVENETHGAMNLYSRKEDAFNGEQIETARLFGVQAAIVLANARAYWSARSRAEQLDQAMKSRAVIEQAKGIVISTMRCDADQAFEVLVKQSQQQNRKLHEIAKEIVTNASRRP